MKLLARWPWVAVLSTALALSWWSLDALARHYGMPSALAAMVSATFDGATLVAADLAMRRATVADSALAVKVLMLATVSLSAWLNYEHGLLLHYPVAVRVLFASPAVIGGSLFELQLRSLYRTRLHELGRVAQPLPRFGLMVWAFHPFAALRRLSQISASRLRSVPVTVMDWESAPAKVHALPGVPVGTAGHPVILAVPIDAADDQAESEASRLDDCAEEDAEEAVHTWRKAGRSPVPDELYLARLQELVADAGGVVPSAREVVRLLSIGQDRARRLVGLLRKEPTDNAGLRASQCRGDRCRFAHCCRA